MSAWVWWALGGMAWTAVAIWIGMGVGRTVRLREDRDDFEAPTADVESDMDGFLSMIREPSEPYRYRGEQP